LRSIAGLQRLTAGSIHVLDHDMGKSQAEAMSQLGFTPDTPAMYDGLSVREFLRFIAIGYGLDAADANERIDFWLEKVWLKEKADQKIKNLSRGMRQRVGIARTLLPNPALVLLDEPAAGLHPAGRVQFRQLLCDLRDQGKALIVSSHILSDMEEYCTHIGIMAQGSMIRFGTVGEVAAHANADGRCRYTILLARPVTKFEELLTGIDGITKVQAERDRATFEFAAAREDAAGLLATLIAKQCRVGSFVAHALGLEEAYLRIGIQQVD
jgi:ABC-2 type transport system ATP-binding protein